MLLYTMNVIKMKHISSLFIFSLAILLHSAPSFAQDTNATSNFETIAKETATINKETKTYINDVIVDVAQKRQDLENEAETIRNASIAKKNEAEALQIRFQELKELEQQLKQELASKEDAIDNIHKTIKINAGLLHQSMPTYMRATLTEEAAQNIANLAENDTFPNLEAVQGLLNALQEPLESSGKLFIVEEPFITHTGKEVKASILHLGAFQNYYKLGDDVGFALQMKSTSYLDVAKYKPTEQEKTFLSAAFLGDTILPIDFTKGEYLFQPPKVYTVMDSIEESGIFGWCILGIAFIGILLVLERFTVLTFVRVNGQKLVKSVIDGQYNEVAMKKSPAGRVLMHMMEGSNEQEKQDIILLERRAEEAMLKEAQPLERFLQAIRVFAAITPLLGLLGTVSGIVGTFRIITLYGNADSKLLSGGISEALLTTELGLLAAIPLLLSYHFLQRRVHTIMTDIDMTAVSYIRHCAK